MADIATIVRACGFQEYDAESITAIARELAGTKKTHPRASFGRVRRAIAKHWGVALREVPKDLSAIAAIRSHQSELSKSREFDYAASFDYHDRQFAEQNGVCPRCSTSITGMVCKACNTDYRL